jgi:hypothetical protein
MVYDLPTVTMDIIGRISTPFLKPTVDDAMRVLIAKGRWHLPSRFHQRLEGAANHLDMRNQRSHSLERKRSIPVMQNELQRW